MKQFKLISLAAIITLVAFSVVFFESCSKSKCAGVSCNNGGTCVNGNCSCATGFSGQHCELIGIYYQNSTYTTINLSINGSTANLLTGATAVVYGAPGSAASGSASTHGLYGNVYHWTINDQFPTNGTPLTQTLSVGADYFFLQVSNIDVYQVNYLTVNSGTPNQSVEAVVLGADRLPYSVGYYKWVPKSVIVAKFSDGHIVTTDSISIPNSTNSSCLLSLP